MSKKNVIDAVEGSKVWGYVAMGAGLLAVVAIAITIKENLEARKAAENLALAEAELDAVKADEPVEEAVENFSGVVGAKYPMKDNLKMGYNTSSVVGRDYPLQRGLTSNWRF